MLPVVWTPRKMIGRYVEGWHSLDSERTHIVYLGRIHLRAGSTKSPDLPQLSTRVAEGKVMVEH
jgi:hypothetical protein